MRGDMMHSVDYVFKVGNFVRAMLVQDLLHEDNNFGAELGLGTVAVTTLSSRAC